ncbi:AAA family ATPase [Thiocapsa sp. UBA6158]|jgi:hypothetical protein|uniref:AAA family ATPase n=1 Tax=Thiocapsa sp. UBA6158 TaxID=1947692 RepID=UPI0025ECDF1C|nr:AAA family ATPase [Thiocapsa sp. UBA6158]
MFLQLLDPRAVQFCFQTFDDSAGKDARLARTLHGTLEERFRELEGLNKRGAGVFVTVNEVDGKARTAENIVRVRAVFADFDPPKTRVAGQTAYPLAPSFEVDSSPGKRHVYWRVDGLDCAEFQAVQTALIALLGSDPAPNDLPRVMRLPGFFHMKNPSKPHMVSIACMEPAAVYNAEQIKRAFPLKLNGHDHREPQEVLSLADRAALTSALFYIPADDRAHWVKMGQALKSALHSHGEDFERLWLSWSATSEKYDPDNDPATWRTFKGTRTGIGAVFAEAQRRGWVNPKSKPAPEPSDVVYRNAAEVQMQPIEWLWDGHLARGKLHILAGAVATGKTTIALAMAATVSIGGRWPDGSIAQLGRVVIWSGEDGIADTLVPRLAAAGADLNQITFLEGIVDNKGRRSFDPSIDIWALYERFAEERPALLIIDSVVSAVSTDSHKNAEVRRSLQPLVDLGHDYGCAVLGISHFTKGTQGGNPVERVTGSLAFGALARVVLAAAKRQELDGGGRIMVRAKSNLGPEGDGVLYDLRVEEIQGGIMASRVLWGGVVKGSAHDLLDAAEKREEPGAVSKGKEAEHFLREELKDGPVAFKDLEKRAEAAGIKIDTLKRAKDRLKIESTKAAGKGGAWRWELPAGAG